MIARRFISALVIALVISGVFTFWLSRKFAKPHAAPPKMQQYVAPTANLEAGEVLQAPKLKLVDWPSAAPLPGAFAKPQDLVGRTVLYPVSADQPIQERQLSAPGAGVGLSVKIPDGMRAISLRTDQVVGVAGFLLPGTHVDVLVTYKVPGSTDPITSMVLQDVEVLTAGQKMQPDPEGKATSVDVVTLLVKPGDAERAVLASAQGSVHFVLRNGSDRVQVIDQPAQLSLLSGHGVAAPAAPVHKVVLVAAPPKTYAVETIAGGKQTVDTFQ